MQTVNFALDLSAHELYVDGHRGFSSIIHEYIIPIRGSLITNSFFIKPSSDVQQYINKSKYIINMYEYTSLNCTVLTYYKYIHFLH